MSEAKRVPRFVVAALLAVAAAACGGEPAAAGGLDEPCAAAARPLTEPETVFIRTNASYPAYATLDGHLVVGPSIGDVEPSYCHENLYIACYRGEFTGPGGGPILFCATSRLATGTRLRMTGVVTTCFGAIVVGMAPMR